MARGPDNPPTNRQEVPEDVFRRILQENPALAGRVDEIMLGQRVIEEQPPMEEQRNDQQMQQAIRIARDSQALSRRLQLDLKESSNVGRGGRKRQRNSRFTDDTDEDDQEEG